MDDLRVGARVRESVERGEAIADDDVGSLDRAQPGNGEQARNAEAIVAAGGAELVPDAELDADRLAALVTSLVSASGRLSTMAAAGQHLMPADAASTLARRVLEVAR